jgi:phosphocarrier protein
MKQREVKISNTLGLHARAAARFVQVASRFQSSIKVQRGNRCMDGKSILGILLIAASCGQRLILIADGQDENDALDALTHLINSGFGDT